MAARWGSWAAARGGEAGGGGSGAGGGGGGGGPGGGAPGGGRDTRGGGGASPPAPWSPPPPVGTTPLRAVAPRHTAIGSATACISGPPTLPPTSAVARVPPLALPCATASVVTKGRDIEVAAIWERTARAPASRSAAAGTRTRRSALTFTGTAVAAVDRAGGSCGRGMGDIVRRTSWAAAAGRGAVPCAQTTPTAPPRAPLTVRGACPLAPVPTPPPPPTASRRPGPSGIARTGRAAGATGGSRATGGGWRGRGPRAGVALRRRGGTNTSLRRRSPPLAATRDRLRRAPAPP